MYLSIFWIENHHHLFPARFLDGKSVKTRASVKVPHSNAAFEAKTLCDLFFPLAAEASFLKAVFSVGANPQHQKVPWVWTCRVLPISPRPRAAQASANTSNSDIVSDNPIPGRAAGAAWPWPERGGAVPAAAAGGQCLPGRGGPGAAGWQPPASLSLCHLHRYSTYANGVSSSAGWQTVS